MLKKIVFSKCFLLLNFATCNAVIYQLIEWEHDKTKQKIFCLSEAHEIRHENIDQQDDIIRVAKHIDAFVIAEDLADYQGENLQIKSQVGKLVGESPLTSLTSLCKQHNIRSKNVEFRFAFTVFGHSLNNGVKTLKNKQGLMLQKEIASEFQQGLDEVNDPKYSTSSVLKKQKRMLKEVLTNNTKKQYTTIIHAIDEQAYPMHQKNDALKRMLSVSSLIPLRTLSQIQNNPHEKNIMIGLGGNYTSVLEQFLPKMGFKEKARIGQSKQDAEKSKTIAAFSLIEFFHQHPDYQVPRKTCTQLVPIYLKKIKRLVWG